MARLVIPRLVVPRRSKLESMVSFPRRAAIATRIYHRTPARLRRVEPATRVALTIATVWFGLLFFSLGMVALRTGSRLPAAGYFVGAALGPVGLRLFLTRRSRIGLAAFGGMLVVGQGVAVASMMVP